MPKRVATIEYMCSWCGVCKMRRPDQGRPEPGNCPRKSKLSNGKDRPHTWVIKKKFYIETRN